MDGSPVPGPMSSETFSTDMGLTSFVMSLAPTPSQGVWGPTTRAHLLAPTPRKSADDDVNPELAELLGQEHLCHADSFPLVGS